MSSASPPARHAHLDPLAVSLLFACCLFWGAQQVMVKATLAELAPVWQAALRFAGATVLLWLWCRWRGIPLAQRDGSLRGGLLAGALFAGEFAALYLGLKHTTASRLTLFLYTSPFWVAVLLPLFTPSERLRPLQWVGLAFAFAALTVGLGGGPWSGLSGSGLSLGDGLGLLAGALWGLTTVVIRASRMGGTSPEKILFYQVSVAAAVLPFISWALGERWTLPASPLAITSIALQTVVGAFGSYLAWMWLLVRYPATQISAFVFLTPVFALIFGALWLGEPVTPQLLLALGLVSVGLVLVNRR